MWAQAGLLLLDEPGIADGGEATAVFGQLEFLPFPSGWGKLHFVGATDFKIHRGRDLAHDESLIERIHTMLSERSGTARRWSSLRLPKLTRI